MMNELSSIEEKIKNAAFKEATFYHLDKQSNEKPESIKVCTRMRVLNSQGGKATVSIIKEDDGFLSSEENLIRMHELLFETDEFISNLAAIISGFKEEYTKEFQRHLVKQIKQSILLETKGYLNGKNTYSKVAVNDAMKLLKNDLNRQFKKPSNRDYLYRSQDVSSDCIDRENIAIEEIRSLYDETFGDRLLDRQIMCNMAFAFVATGFWPDIKKNARPNSIKTTYERIKKRLQNIEK